MYKMMALMSACCTLAQHHILVFYSPLGHKKYNNNMTVWIVCIFLFVLESEPLYIFGWVFVHYFFYFDTNLMPVANMLLCLYFFSLAHHPNCKCCKYVTVSSETWDLKNFWSSSHLWWVYQCLLLWNFSNTLWVLCLQVAFKCLLITVWI